MGGKMKQAARCYFGVFLGATALSIGLENYKVALLSLVFLISSMGLWLYAHHCAATGKRERRAVWVKPIGIAVLTQTVYHMLSLVPAVFELPMLEQPLSPETIETTIIWFLMGTSAVWIGFFLNVGDVLANALASQIAPTNEPNRAAVLAFAKRSWVAALGLYGLTVFVAGYNHPIDALLDMSEFRRKALSLGVTTAFATVLFLLFAIPKTMWLAQLADKNQKFSVPEKRFWALFIISEVAVSFTFGIRGVFVLTVLLLFVAWHYRTQRVPLGWLVVGGVGAAVVVAGFGLLREYLALSETERETLGALLRRAMDSAESSGELVLTTVLKRFDALQRFGEIVEGFSEHFSDEHLLWGKGIVGDLLLYVPRALLPFEKPYTTSYYFTEMFYPNLVGVFSFEVSFLGEAFLNFGKEAIPAVALLIGIALRTMTELFNETRLQASWRARFWYFWTLVLPVSLLNQGLFMAIMPQMLGVVVASLSLRIVRGMNTETSSQQLVP